MDKNHEYIEQFLRGELKPEQIKDIDDRIVRDPEFASQLAFHISALNALRAQSNHDLRTRFRTLYKPKGKQVRAIWTYAAAAAVLSIVFTGIYFFFSNPSPTQLADNYIRSNLGTLGVTMSSTPDSIQFALALYNAGKLEEAEEAFEAIVAGAPNNFKVREYHGIVSLRLEDYDKALSQFDTLSKATHLYANSGRFYYSLALLKRNRPGDVKSAKSILQQVVSTEGANHRAARELLQQL